MPELINRRTFLKLSAVGVLAAVSSACDSKETTPKPVSTPLSEPVPEATDTPVPKPTVEPTKEPTSEPTQETTPDINKERIEYIGFGGFILDMRGVYAPGSPGMKFNPEPAPTYKEGETVESVWKRMWFEDILTRRSPTLRDAGFAPGSTMEEMEEYLKKNGSVIDFEYLKITDVKRETRDDGLTYIVATKELVAGKVDLNKPIVFKVRIWDDDKYDAESIPQVFPEIKNDFEPESLFTATNVNWAEDANGSTSAYLNFEITQSGQFIIRWTFWPYAENWAGEEYGFMYYMAGVFDTLALGKPSMDRLPYEWVVRKNAFRWEENPDAVLENDYWSALAPGNSFVTYNIS